jgi:hypothetical protein
MGNTVLQGYDPQMAQWILVEKLTHKCLHTIGHNPHAAGPEIHLSSCLGRNTIPQKLNNEFSMIPDFFVWHCVAFPCLELPPVSLQNLPPTQSPQLGS